VNINVFHPEPDNEQDNVVLLDPASLAESSEAAAETPPTRSELEFHPIADMFSLMEGLEFDELVDDIKLNGLLEAIHEYEGKILEGRNRYRACEMAGVQPRFVSYEGDDPGGFVISKNVRRRHLTPEQKRDSVAKLLKANPHRSNRATARIAGVSDKTVDSVRQDLEARSEIPHVETRTDSKGRQQRSTNAANKTDTDTGAAPTVNKTKEPAPAAPKVKATTKQQESEAVAKAEKKRRDAAKEALVAIENADGKDAVFALLVDMYPEWLVDQSLLIPREVARESAMMSPTNPI
jgi:hypothetical protein